MGLNKRFKQWRYERMMITKNWRIKRYVSGSGVVNHKIQTRGWLGGWFNLTESTQSGKYIIWFSTYKEATSRIEMLIDLYKDRVIELDVIVDVINFE
jgi:hypothetical protein